MENSKKNKFLLSSLSYSGRTEGRAIDFKDFGLGLNEGFRLLLSLFKFVSHKGFPNCAKPKIDELIKKSSQPFHFVVWLFAYSIGGSRRCLLLVPGVAAPR